jgi:pimeloyl-ACP methyl ester carboxylesterase
MLLICHPYSPSNIPVSVSAICHPISVIRFFDAMRLSNRRFYTPGIKNPTSIFVMSTKRNIRMKNWLTILICLVASAVLAQTPAAKTLKSKGYAPVNGLKMYYEIHGEGKPVVLLHGSYMNIDMNWSQLMPELAKSRNVIALEMQGHGRTNDANREFAFESLADDVAGLLKHLKIDSTDVLGYSLGGTVAYALAIRHPKVVNKLVIISSAFRYDGWTAASREIFQSMDAKFFEATPIKTDYDRLAPDKTHWNAFMDKMIAFDKKPYDLGAANIKNIKAPVLLISGDNDGVDLNHIAEMYRLAGGGVMADMVPLPKSRLAIIPGMSHVNLMMQTEKLASIIMPYLNNENPSAPQH